MTFSLSKITAGFKKEEAAQCLKALSQNTVPTASAH